MISPELPLSLRAEAFNKLHEQEDHKKPENIIFIIPYLPFHLSC